MKNELTPTVIGLGIFHGKLDSHFQEMKSHYLNEFLNHGKKPIKFYLKELKNIDRWIRNYYFPQPTISTEELSETMMLDGGFLLGLFMKHDECLNNPSGTTRVEGRPGRKILDAYEYIPQHVMSTLKRDLLKYENQIPFEVVQLLWGIQHGTEPSSIAKLHKLCMDFFEIEVPSLLHRSRANSRHQHLLEIYYSNYMSLHPHKIKTPPNAVVTTEPGLQVPNNQTFTSVPTATNLKEYGVKFNRSSHGNQIWVEYEEKNLGLPFLKIDDMNRCILANFVIHEQVCASTKPISALCSFLNSLMRDEKDVNVLAKKGILENTTGNDKEVAEFFSHACLDVEIERNYLQRVIDCVNHDFHSQLKRWWGTFMVEFFRLPWSIPVFFYGIISVVFNIIRFILQIRDHNRK